MPYSEEDIFNIIENNANVSEDQYRTFSRYLEHRLYYIDSLAKSHKLYEVDDRADVSGMIWNMYLYNEPVRFFPSIKPPYSLEHYPYTNALFWSGINNNLDAIYPLYVLQNVGYIQNEEKDFFTLHGPIPDKLNLLDWDIAPSGENTYPAYKIKNLNTSESIFSKDEWVFDEDEEIVGYNDVEILQLNTSGVYATAKSNYYTNKKHCVFYRDDLFQGQSFNGIFDPYASGLKLLYNRNHFLNLKNYITIDGTSGDLNNQRLMRINGGIYDHASGQIPVDVNYTQFEDQLKIFKSQFYIDTFMGNMFTYRKRGYPKWEIKDLEEENIVIEDQHATEETVYTKYAIRKDLYQDHMIPFCSGAINTIDFYLVKSGETFSEYQDCEYQAYLTSDVGVQYDSNFSTLNRHNIPSITDSYVGGLNSRRIYTYTFDHLSVGNSSYYIEDISGKLKPNVETSAGDKSIFQTISHKESEIDITHKEMYNTCIPVSFIPLSLKAMSLYSGQYNYLVDQNRDLKLNEIDHDRFKEKHSYIEETFGDVRDYQNKFLVTTPSGEDLFDRRIEVSNNNYSYVDITNSESGKIISYTDLLPKINYSVANIFGFDKDSIGSGILKTFGFNEISLTLEATDGGKQIDDFDFLDKYNKYFSIENERDLFAARWDDRHTGLLGWYFRVTQPSHSYSDGSDHSIKISNIDYSYNINYSGIVHIPDLGRDTDYKPYLLSSLNDFIPDKNFRDRNMAPIRNPFNLALQQYDIDYCDLPYTINHQYIPTFLYNRIYPQYLEKVNNTFDFLPDTEKRRIAQTLIKVNQEHLIKEKVLFPYSTSYGYQHSLISNFYTKKSRENVTSYKWMLDANSQIFLHSSNYKDYRSNYWYGEGIGPYGDPLYYLKNPIKYIHTFPYFGDILTSSVYTNFSSTSFEYSDISPPLTLYAYGNLKYITKYISERTVIGAIDQSYTYSIGSFWNYENDDQVGILKHDGSLLYDYDKIINMVSWDVTEELGYGIYDTQAGGYYSNIYTVKTSNNYSNYLTRINPITGEVFGNMITKTFDYKPVYGGITFWREEQVIDTVNMNEYYLEYRLPITDYYYNRIEYQAELEKNISNTEELVADLKIEKDPVNFVYGFVSLKDQDISKAISKAIENKEYTVIDKFPTLEAEKTQTESVFNIGNYNISEILEKNPGTQDLIFFAIVPEVELEQIEPKELYVYRDPKHITTYSDQYDWYSLDGLTLYKDNLILSQTFEGVKLRYPYNYYKLGWGMIQNSRNSSFITQSREKDKNIEIPSSKELDRIMQAKEFLSDGIPIVTYISGKYIRDYEEETRILKKPDNEINTLINQSNNKNNFIERSTYYANRGGFLQIERNDIFNRQIDLE